MFFRGHWFKNILSHYMGNDLWVERMRVKEIIHSHRSSILTLSVSTNLNTALPFGFKIRGMNIKCIGLSSGEYKTLIHQCNNLDRTNLRADWQISSCLDLPHHHCPIHCSWKIS